VPVTTCKSRIGVVTWARAPSPSPTQSSEKAEIISGIKLLFRRYGELGVAGALKYINSVKLRRVALSSIVSYYREIAAA